MPLESINNSITEVIMGRNRNAILAYIDLCGTRELYFNQQKDIEKQAEEMYQKLLKNFQEQFSKFFNEAEIRNNFNVNIYGDSIMICERIETKNVETRFVDFLLAFQLNNQRTRAIVDSGPFFYLLHSISKCNRSNFKGRFIAQTFSGPCVD